MNSPSRSGRFSGSSRWRPPGARRGTDPHTHNGSESPSEDTHTHTQVTVAGRYLLVFAEVQVFVLQSDSESFFIKRSLCCRVFHSVSFCFISAALVSDTF